MINKAIINCSCGCLHGWYWYSSMSSQANVIPHLTRHSLVMTHGEAVCVQSALCCRYYWIYSINDVSSCSALSPGQDINKTRDKDTIQVYVVANQWDHELLGLDIGRKKQRFPHLDLCQNRQRENLLKILWITYINLQINTRRHLPQPWFWAQSLCKHHTHGFLGKTI